jgi:adenine-specific DNA-methyltransferase
MTEFSPLSISLTKSLNKTVKKNHGIFITPRSIIKQLFDIIAETAIPIKTILEPSCGSGEMVCYADSLWSDVEIDGVEFNDTIYQGIVSGLSSFRNRVNLIHADFTKYAPSKKYDLIVGNPPFVVCDKETVPAQYLDLMVGRPNLFCVFIAHSLSLLKDGGIMAFVVPRSFLNAAYYAKIRNHLMAIGRIVRIADFTAISSLFIDTDQATIGLVFQKTPALVPTICSYSIKLGSNYMFTDNSTHLRQILAGSTTLANLGMVVKTGTIVWNQHKSLMVSSNVDGVPLLYNSNVASSNTIQLMEFANDEKKQYIRMPGQTGKMLVVNRGNGNSAYKLSYALVDSATIGPYLVENHLNMIYPCANSTLTAEQIDTLFNQIVASFQHEKTNLFITTFLGNNGLSKTELETIFPIWTNL